MDRHPFNSALIDGRDDDSNSASKTVRRDQQPLALGVDRVSLCTSGTAFHPKTANCRNNGLPLQDNEIKKLRSHEACRLALISLERRLKKLSTQHCTYCGSPLLETDVRGFHHKDVHRACGLAVLALVVD